MSQQPNQIEQLGHLGQSIWIDYLHRDDLENGRLQQLIDLGVTGVTSNPVILRQALTDSVRYNESIRQHAATSTTAEEVYERVVTEDIRAAADLLRPVYEATDKVDGYVSLEVNPSLAHDASATIEAAHRLWQLVNRPNLMIKVPGTASGTEAIRSLIGAGININVTLLFSLQAHRDAAAAYIEGLYNFVAARRGAPKHVASVASFFVSRVDSAIDQLLPKDDPRRGQLGIANARAAYQQFHQMFNRERNSGSRFYPIFTTGARVQRPLWGSTSVKNPEYPATMYVRQLAGRDTVNTLPPATLEAVLQDYDFVNDQLNSDHDDSVLGSLKQSAISLDTVTERLLEEGLDLFVTAYNDLIQLVAQKTHAAAIKV